MQLDIIRRLAASRAKVSTSDTVDSAINTLRYPKPPLTAYGALLPHQVDHCQRLKDILGRRGIAGDTSKPGTGKTYVASQVAADLHLPVLVFCPKPIMSKWYDVLRTFGNSVATITNYDMARSAHSEHVVKWYDMRQGHTDKASVCPWITKTKRVRKGKDVIEFHWNLPYRCLIIFDEEHVGKNIHTQTFAFINGAVKAAKEQGHPLLYASATPIERKMQLKSIMKFLGVIDKADMLAVNKFFRKQIGSTAMSDIHKYLYDKNTGCMSWMPEAEIPDHITNTVSATTYKMSDEITAKIAEHNREILALKEEMRQTRYAGKKLAGDTLGNINLNRRYIETYKASIIGDRALAMLKEGYYVPIFVNYKSTLYALQERLSKDYDVAVLHGDQNAIESEKAKDDFNDGKVRVLISTISKGGVSLSFHDTSEGGTRPRYSIISVPTSATALIQCIGRCFRTNVTSSVITEIPFCDGDPMEVNLRDLVNRKSHDISRFTIGKENDFDLQP